MNRARVLLSLLLLAAAIVSALAVPGVASAACPGGSSTYASAVTGNGTLRGYWRLDDASPSATACATKGPTGTYNGGVTLGTTPSATTTADGDTAITLDGTSGFVSVPDDGTLNPSPFTIEAWVKPPFTTGSQAVARKDGQYYLKIYDGKLQGWIWTSATTKVTVTSTSAVMTTGQWQQVAFTYNGSTGTLYRNGVSVGSAAVSATIPTTANALHWGDTFTANLDQNFLAGGLDEAALYGSALSATEIANHFQLANTAPPTAPAAPTGLGATGGAKQVSLSWTGSSGATSYNLYRGTTAGGESTTAVKTGITGTTYTDPGLADSTTYYYVVKAANSVGESGPSNEANATTSPPTPPPPPPTGLSATGGAKQISLSWTAAGGASSYNIYRATNAGGPYPTKVNASPVTGTTFNDTGLADSATFYYIVTSVGPGGESTTNSNEAHARPTRPRRARLGPPPTAPRSSAPPASRATGAWARLPAPRRPAPPRARTAAMAAARRRAAGGIFGDPDTAVGLNGTSGYVGIPNAAALNPSRLTVEAWVKPNRRAAARRSPARTASTTSRSTTASSRRGCGRAPPQTSTPRAPRPGLVAGQWQLVAMTYDGTAFGSTATASRWPRPPTAAHDPVDHQRAALGRHPRQRRRGQLARREPRRGRGLQPALSRPRS